MFTGKTTIGRAVALKTGMQFADTDSIIEERRGLTINEIFHKHGEQYFRMLEKEVVSDVSRLNEAVISCGGGVVKDKDNMGRLKENGLIVCLYANTDVIYDRLKNSDGNRPLLRDMSKENIMEFMRIREPLYKDADVFLDTSFDSVSDISDSIIRIYQNR